jgi:hypothetical protein
MTIDDPQGLASSSEITMLQDAIDDFAGWTGRSGVCVPGLEVVREEEIDAWGQYNGPGKPIQIAMPANFVAWHELCHALDRQEGFSRRYSSFFPPDIDDPDPPSESFAYACQLVWEVGLLAGMDGSCESYLEPEVAALLRQEVYVNKVDDPLAGAPMPLHLERYPIRGLAGGLDSVLSHSPGGIVGIEYGTVGDAVVVIDPYLGQVTARYPLPEDHLYNAATRFYATDGLPMLVSATQDTSHVLRYSAAVDGLVEVDFPQMTHPGGGIVQGEKVSFGAVFSADPTSFVRAELDLVSETLTTEPLGDLGWFYAMEQAGEALMMEGSRDSRTTELYWWQGEELQTTVLPWDGSWAAPAQGGKVAVSTWRGLYPEKLGISVYNREEDQWRVGTDACGANALPAQASVPMEPWQDHAWFLDQEFHGDLRSATLVKVVLEE